MKETMNKTVYKMDNGSESLYTLEELKDVFNYYQCRGIIDYDDFESWLNDGIENGFLTACSR